MKPKPLKLKRAWLVSWDGTSPQAKTPVAILDYRKGEKSVGEFVERLYMVLRYVPEEQLRYTRSPKENPYPAEIGRFGRITCGHNPWLIARVVTGLHVAGDEVRWTEPPPISELIEQYRAAGLVRS